MTRIEERVRQAFDAETAGLVPADDLAGTIVTRGSRIRRVRRAGAGAAVAAAVALALIIPVGVLDSADPPAPAESPQTGPDTNLDQLPMGAPPKVLYAENPSEVELNLLHDGEKQASLNSGQAIIPIARIGGSWLVVVTVVTNGTEPPATSGDLALMAPNGSEPVWLSSGVDPAQVSVSPDGSQAAFVKQVAEPASQVVVIDLLTESVGTQRAERPMGPGDQLLGWNPDGIWLRTGSTTSVWRPGSAPRPVPEAGPVRIDRHTRRVVEHFGPGCIGVAELRAASLARLWQRCREDGYADAVLSPDGRYIALPDGEAVAVDGGATRRTARWDDNGSAVWEDATHLLIQTAFWGAGEDGSHRTIVVRCNVPAERCERAYDRTVKRPPVARWFVLARP
jgi:hypothetical protein